MTLIAAAQFGPILGDAEANRDAAARAVREAAAAGAALIVLPELSDSGDVFTDVHEARGLASPAASSPTPRQWQELAADHGVVIVGGFCELGPDGLLYNSAALVDESGTRAVYRKAHLWDREKLIFTPGGGAPHGLGGGLAVGVRVPDDRAELDGGDQRHETAPSVR